MSGATSALGSLVPSALSAAVSHLMRIVVLSFAIAGVAYHLSVVHAEVPTGTAILTETDAGQQI